jgi:hypothetical protein
LSVGPARNLMLAAEAMGRAREELEGARPSKAEENQEEALRRLREGREDMASASQSAAGLQAGAGQGMAGSIQLAPSSGGGAGARLEPVRIPRARDYRPPREFREEVLKSMKEKYPKAQEGVIKDYYEKWAK